MTYDLTGRIAAVDAVPLGGALAEDAPAGSTTLVMEDTADFDEDGGVLLINGAEQIAYVAVDDDAGAITLAAPTAAAYDTEARVEVFDPTTGAVVSEVQAQILVEGWENAGDSLTATVDHALIPYLPLGIRGTDPSTGETGEAVALERRGDELYVVDVLGRAPVFDGSVIDPDTLPPTGGGAEPEEPVSPMAPAVVGGIGSLLIRWTPIAHPNPVTYEVHVSDVSPVEPSEDTLVGEITGSQITVRRLPVPNEELDAPDSPLSYDVTYYAVVIAKDSVDPTYASEPSEEGAGSPVQATSGDLAAQSVTAETIAVGSITGEAFAGELLLGSRITTGEAGARVEMDVDGFRLYNSADDLRVNLPTAPGDDPSFRGRVEADGLTVREGAQFFSTLNEFAKDSRISLAEQVAAPVSSPQVQPIWGSVQLEQRSLTGTAGTFALDPSQISCAAWHSTLNVFLVAQNRPSGGSRIWYYTTEGTLAGLSPQPIRDYSGNDGEYMVTGMGTTPDGELITLFRFANDGWWIDDPRRTNRYRRYELQNPGRTPGLTVAPNGDIYVVEQSTSGPTIFRRVDTSTTPVTVAATTTVSGVADAFWTPSFAYVGPADFGSTRFVIGNKSTNSCRVFNSSGAYQTNETWRPPVTRAGGFWAPSPIARFFTVGADGRLYMHSNITWTSPSQDTWHLAQSFYDNNTTGGTHETLVGAVRSFEMTKRAFLRVTLQQVPFAGGSDDPNRWRLYGKIGSAPGANGAGMTLQAEGPYTSTQHTQGVMLTTSGTAPPTSSNFPGATPARIVSARARLDNPALPIFEARGDGSGRWGVLEFNNDGTMARAGVQDTSGPVSLSLSTGWTAESLTYEVRGGIVFVSGSRVKAASNAVQNLAFMPAGLAPSTVRRVIAYNHTNADSRFLSIQTSGTIQSPGSPGSNLFELSFTMSYPAAG